MDPSSPPPQTDRREFISKAAALVIGGSITVAPVAAGLCLLFDPLKREAAGGRSIQVASLSSIPESGEPVKFPVIATLVDAWNRIPNAQIGAVYLSRTKEGKVRALNVVCPHTGCPVGFRSAGSHYHCPCHDSTFTLAGQILDPNSPSPRGLDELPVEIRNNTEVWVTFQNFRPGTHEKIPV